MKTLLLLRHAKSNWDDPTIDDIDRPLSPSGIRTAVRIGDYMRRRGLLPDHVLCSSAVRATSTWDQISAGWPPEITVERDRMLYLAAPAVLLRRLAELHRDANRVMIIGHNPGLHRLAFELTFDAAAETSGKLGGDFPTAALAAIGLQSESWQGIQRPGGRLLYFIRPRDLE